MDCVIIDKELIHNFPLDLRSKSAIESLANIVKEIEDDWAVKIAYTVYGAEDNVGKKGKGE